VPKFSINFEKIFSRANGNFEEHNVLESSTIIINYFTIIIIHLLQSALQPLVGFRPAQLSLSILSRKVLPSAVASCTSNPQLGGEPGI
jgi:hypothetical protein